MAPKLIKTTLSCIINEKTHQILMIYKKRGWGEGKYNFRGGKLEENETFKNCCIRETIEETGIKVLNPKLIGKLEFSPDNGKYHLRCGVFISTKYEGSLIKDCNECSCFWRDLDDIPYDKMWKSDKTWLPNLIKRKRFSYNFLDD